MTPVHLQCRLHLDLGLEDICNKSTKLDDQPTNSNISETEMNFLYLAALQKVRICFSLWWDDAVRTHCKSKLIDTKFILTSFAVTWSFRKTRFHSCHSHMPWKHGVGKHSIFLLPLRITTKSGGECEHRFKVWFHQQTEIPQASLIRPPNSISYLMSHTSVTL